MKHGKQDDSFFDDVFPKNEQLPRKFTVTFEASEIGDKKAVKVILNDTVQIGDIIDDNAYENDYYRFHDIFHYTFAVMLGWSPCARAMIKCKRKSNPIIDKIEDGARAAITEEAISLLIFNEAKRNSLFSHKASVSRATLRLIKAITEPYEVKTRSMKEWEKAIIKGYEVFRMLIHNEGGRVSFNGISKEVHYLS